MSWTKYRERRRSQSSEVSLNDSKDSSLGEENQGGNVQDQRSRNSNHGRWLEDRELLGRRVERKDTNCVPFLVNLIHSRDQSPVVRQGASGALRNIIDVLDDKKGREQHVLELIERLRDYCEKLKMVVNAGFVPENPNKHPNSTMTTLMKLSFNENYHRTICYLGGLQTIAELIECEHAAHGSENNVPDCITLRRDSGMTLASLIIGDSTNKVLLCSFRDFLKVWVKQLFSPCEELRQVTASVFCNLSWRAENESKQALREAGVVSGLMKAAMLCRRENCLKIILSALWNLSAHCAANKAEICAVEGALSFLVNTLCYESPSKGLAIAENAGGIIRNVSSHIAMREDYRAILRQKNCIQILIRHLKSPSLTVITNACGTLWNLSAWCPRDQKTLWELGAIPLLKNLASSKHKMISKGASGALRNLLTTKGANGSLIHENRVRRPQLLEMEDNLSMISRKRDSVGARAHMDLDVSKGGCVKKNLFAESMYRYERGFAPIDLRSNYSSHDRSLIKQRSVPTAYISTEPGKKLKFCIRMTSETCEYTETKENFRSPTNVPWNSPPDMPSYNQPRVCSPVEENHDEASACTEISRSSFEKPYQNFINRSPSDSTCDEDINDQPVDYSKKYSERNPSQNNLLESPQERSSKKEFPDHEDKVDLFGDYVETDLDQPTDYSLRYAEDDTDEDEKSNPEYFPRNEQEDTVKTYCTEGTPYQTPFNFSTATSMSDLRVEDPKEGEVFKKFSKKMDLRSKNSDPDSKDLQFDESKEMIEEGEHLLNTDVNLTEKPISYCVEGTPRCFSRVSSLSSLGSALITQSVSIEVVSKEVTNDLGCHPLEREGAAAERSTQKREPVSGERERNDNRIIDKEGKVVTFRREDHYAEQTPLMFSRCSSLGSLSGFEQHSIRDDLSSGISDFSRMTSGVVSPSELPDSPTQTVPPSPRHHKHAASEFGKKALADARHSFQNQSFSKMQSGKRSVFEDEMSAFKEESTPLEFSAATSLSSLTIDDDESKLPRNLKRLIGKRSIVPENDESENSGSRVGNHLSGLERENIDDLRQNNEDLHNDRYMHASNPQKSILLSQSSNLRRFETSFRLNRLDPTAITARVDPISASDSVHVYCTEDTPDGSISNLSALSMPSILDDNENIDHNKLLDLAKFKSSDEGSNSSGDNEILEERLDSENTKDQNNPQSPRDLRQNTSLDVPSDDSVSLTEEENNKLDQLIESAMPKRRLNDSTSPTTSEQNLRRSSPAPSNTGNSSLEEESIRVNQLIEPSSVPSSPKGSLKNRSSSSLQQACKIESPSPVPFEEDIKVYSLLESEMDEVPLNVPSSSPNSPQSPRSPSPENTTLFYRTNPCGRSSTPTTLVQKSGKDSPLPVPSPVPSEDRVSLTEEENIKLDQLIESAMPKRQNALSPSPSVSPKLLMNKSNYNSPSRRFHSSSQSDILIRDLNNDFIDEENRIDQLSEFGIPKKRLSVSSRSSPVNIRGRSDPYSDDYLPPLRQQPFKPKITRETMSEFAFSQEENMRLEQLIQSSKKRLNHAVKTSPPKIQDHRSNKSNSYDRSTYNSMQQNVLKSDRINPESEDDTISMTEEDNFKLDQLIASAMPKKHTTQPFHRSSSGRVLDNIPANRMLPYGCSSPPSTPQQNIRRTGRIKSEQNENRNSLTVEENLRLDQLIESAMPKKRVNSSLKPTASKVPVDNMTHRSNTCIRSSNPSLRRHSYGTVGKWKYYKRLGFSRILRFIRENYP